MEIIKLKNLSKSYEKHQIFHHFNLSVNQGDFVMITGKSGCGKSTLLNIIGLIEPFDDGEYILYNHKNIKINSKEYFLMLRYHINFIFQNFALMEDDTVKNNLLIALEYSKLSKQEKEHKIHTVLKELGLEEYLNVKINTLSGGQQQRIAIARCILKPCDIILADEPTGALDNENKKIIMDILKKLNDNGKTIIVATHDENFSLYCSKKIIL